MLPHTLSDQDKTEQFESLLSDLAQKLNNLPGKYRKQFASEIAYLHTYLEESENPGPGGRVRVFAAESPRASLDGVMMPIGRPAQPPEPDFLQTIIQADPGCLAVLTVPDMIFRLANPAYRAILPDPSVDPVGLSLDQFWPEEEARQARQLFQDVIATGHGIAEGYQWSITSPRDGLPHWYKVNVTPIEWNRQPAVLVVGWEMTRVQQTLHEVSDQKDQLDEASQRLQSVLSSITDLYFALDREWRFIEINPQAERYVFRRPASELIGQVYWDAFPQTIGTIFLENYARAVRENRPVHFEAKTLFTERWIEIHVYPRADRLEIYGRDITDRKLAEAALKLSEERFRVALASIPIIVFSMDRSLRYTWVYNPVSGFTDRPYLGKRDDEIIPNETVESLVALKRQVIETGQPVQTENSLHYNGKLHTFRISLNPMLDASGAVTGLTGSALDITEHRQLEAEQREFNTQMEVQRRLAEHREMERQNIAREIHDGPIQGLVSTLFHLQRAKEELVKSSQEQPTSSESRILSTFDLVMNNLRGTVQGLRALMNDLRPPSLLHFGLARVIQIHSEDLRERYPHLKIDLDLFDDRNLFPEEVCLALYRVYQESLNNIIHHASASQIWIRSYAEDQWMILEIQDNGAGFQVPSDWVSLARSNHFGIMGMKERVEAVGGEFSIQSTPEHGTTVRIRVPVTMKK